MPGETYESDIRARKRIAGSIIYTAQIRLIREGAQVYQESQTFARKQAARHGSFLWILLYTLIFEWNSPLSTDLTSVYLQS